METAEKKRIRAEIRTLWTDRWTDRQKDGLGTDRRGCIRLPLCLMCLFHKAEQRDEGRGVSEEKCGSRVTDLHHPEV